MIEYEELDWSVSVTNEASPEDEAAGATDVCSTCTVEVTTADGSTNWLSLLKQTHSYKVLFKAQKSSQKMMTCRSQQ